MVNELGGIDCQLLLLRPPPDEIWIGMVPLHDLQKEGASIGAFEAFLFSSKPPI